MVCGVIVIIKPTPAKLTLPTHDPFREQPVWITAKTGDVQVVGRGVTIMVKQGSRIVLPPG